MAGAAIGRAPSDLGARTEAFALAIIQLVEALPYDSVAVVRGKQLLRAGTSVGANYRAARRAESPAGFMAKMSIVEEEADECAYWLELLRDSNLVPQGEPIAALLAESNELVAITVASINPLIPRSAIRIPRSIGGGHGPVRRTDHLWR
jgi:four helix bundle protein